MKAVIQIVFLSIFQMMLCNALLAQSDPCLTGLKDANQMTEKGKYDEAIILIKATLENCALNKKDKIQANNLLIVNYLAIDNLEAAEAVAATIMKIDPNYEPDKLRDEPAVIVLFQKYKPTVVLKGIVFGGVNTSRVRASQTYSMVTDNKTPGLDKYKSLTGFQIGLGVEQKLYQSFWLQGSFIYRNSGYSIEIPNVQGRTISYKEDLNYFDIPIAAKYYFLKSSFQPFVQAGINLSFLNSALGELSRDKINDIIDRKPQRNSFYAGYFGGFGLAYDFSEFSIQGGLDYFYVPRNLNKTGTRYYNTDAVFKYYYLDNDFTMDNIVLNFGFSYAIGYRNVLTNKAKK